MNIPFPIVYPGMFIPDLLNDDETTPHDEDAELSKLENEHKNWLDSIGNQYKKHVPLGMQTPPPVTPIESEADNEESTASSNDENILNSDDSHEMDVEDESPDSDPPPEYEEEEEEEEERESPDETRSTPDSDASTLILPYVPYGPLQ